jgi:predicted helicase
MTAAAFRGYAAIGKLLAELRVHYEPAAEYLLQRIEASGEPLNGRVEKMRLTKAKTALTYHSFLSLVGIPAAAFTYRLGKAGKRTYATPAVPTIPSCRPDALPSP